MFKKLLTAMLLFIAITSKADESQKVASKVQKVTVFLRGAQVNRTALVNLSAGTSELVFEGISAGIDVNSIQVHADGEFTILSVKSSMNNTDAGEDAKIKAVEELQMMQKTIRDKIEIQNNLLAIYQSEENVLVKNQFVRPVDQNLDIIKLRQSLDFQTERLTALKLKEQVVKNRIAVLNKEVQNYDVQIALINEKSINLSTNIIVSVSSKTPLQSTFNLSYFIANASWYPSYDIRAKNINSPLTIVYKANVSQKSGEDWKNIKLTLSTGNSTSNSIKPDLDPYYINFAVNNSVNYSRALSGSVSGISLNEYAVKRNADNAYTIPVEVNMVENQINSEFNIENPYSITDDGKLCQVEINQFSLKANYQYYVAPKISNDVFLTAQVTDWNKYNLLSGDANLYFEGTYIGKSKIDTRVLNDTLNLSLGNDKSILVKRTLEKNLTEKQSLGANIKETRNWVIEIKNRKNQKVNLLVEDQVPVSQNSLISVEVQNTSGARTDMNTGKLSWNFLLNSQGDKKVQFRYQVKYPKNQSVIVQ